MLQCKRQYVPGLPEGKCVLAGHDLEAAWQRVTLLPRKLDAFVVSAEIGQRRMRSGPQVSKSGRVSADHRLTCQQRLEVIIVRPEHLVDGRRPPTEQIVPSLRAPWPTVGAPLVPIKTRREAA